jgi:hypothetical protein
MFARPRKEPLKDRSLDLEEIRLVSDLRIMHSKVDELYQVVTKLRQRHSEADVYKYADDPVIFQNIERMDEIYLWFVKVKEERERMNGD